LSSTVVRRASGRSIFRHTQPASRATNNFVGGTLNFFPGTKASCTLYAQFRSLPHFRVWLPLLMSLCRHNPPAGRQSGEQVPSLALPDAASGRTNISVFETGNSVPASGLYAIIRSVHRLPRAVFLSAGQRFPGCSLCTESVQFWLLQQTDAPAGVDVSLRALPVLDTSSAAPANTAR